MLVYRVSKTKHVNDLSGEGARLYGGRWNPKGMAILYVAETPSLAMLESLVHYDSFASPMDLSLVTIEISDRAGIESPSRMDYPDDWNTLPPPNSTAKFGHKWYIAGNTPILRVPSVVAPFGFGWNYLVNPAHPELFSIAVVSSTPWEIDSRFFS